MDVIRQPIQVTFSYPVIFTTGLFSPSNPTYQNVFRQQPPHPARILFVLDHGVVEAHPSLTRAIEAYCNAHPDALTMSASPLVIQGGESAKNDSRVTTR